jgi:hypothetical protein
LLPIAPFNKFAGPSSTLQAWEDGVVRLDNTEYKPLSPSEPRPNVSAIEETGLVDVCEVLCTAYPEKLVVDGVGIFGLGLQGRGSGGRGAGRGDGEGELRSKLARAEAEVQRWQENYMELYEKAVRTLQSAPMDLA